LEHYLFDTQTLIEHCSLDEIELRDAITNKFVGNSLIVGGDHDLMKLHFHTDHPGKIIDFCATLGDIFDVVIENMDRQAIDKKG